MAKRNDPPTIVNNVSITNYFNGNWLAGILTVLAVYLVQSGAVEKLIALLIEKAL